MLSFTQFRTISFNILSLPTSIRSINYNYYKQVCVYGFKPEALQFYCDYGEKYGKAKVESVEDIEILRFIENGYKVQYIEVDSNTVAVDTANDLEKVRDIVKSRIKDGSMAAPDVGGY